MSNILKKYIRSLNKINNLDATEYTYRSQLAVFLKVPVNYFYEDYSGHKAEEATATQEEAVDLNYSFLVKIFSKLSNNQKSKILQILKNTSDLRETG